MNYGDGFSSFPIKIYDNNSSNVMRMMMTKMINGNAL